MTEFKALALIAENDGYCGVVKLSDSLGISRPAAVRLLFNLVRAGTTRRVGPPLGGRWEIVGTASLWAPTEQMEDAQPT